MFEFIVCKVCDCGIYTWNAFPLYGPGYDGDWLLAGLVQNLTELLHTVAVHNHGPPAERNAESVVLLLNHLRFINISLPLRPDVLLPFKVVLSNGSPNF